jgi:L-alanine-DL-glutamate epimerase-like enolase superfamily enzyme
MGVLCRVSASPRAFATPVAPFASGDPRPSLTVALSADNLSGYGEVVGWPGRRAMPDEASVLAAGACVTDLPPDRDGLQAALARLGDPALDPGAAWGVAAAFAELVSAASGTALACLWRSDSLRSCEAVTEAEATGLMLSLGPVPPGRGLKLKIRPDTDGDALRALAATRPPASLRLDGNHALNLRAAVALAEAAGAALQWLEEPVEPQHLAELGRTWPLALDESLADGDLDHVARLIDRARPRALVLKPAVLGPARTLSLAALGRARGISVVVSSLFEGALGLSALAALQAGLAPEVAAGLGTGRFLVGQDESRVDASGRLLVPLPSPSEARP